jgi:hypothetical protein
MNNDKSQPEKPELPPDPFPDDAFLDSPVTGRTLLAVANLVAQDIDKPVTTRAFLEAGPLPSRGSTVSMMRQRWTTARVSASASGTWLSGGHISNFIRLAVRSRKNSAK